MAQNDNHLDRLSNRMTNINLQQYIIINNNNKCSHV